MFVRFVSQNFLDGVERPDFVFLFVVPMDDVRQVRTTQIQDQKSAQQQSAHFGARTGKAAGQNQRQQRQGRRKNHQPPAGLVDAEGNDLPGEVFVGKTARLQITH